MRKLNNVHIKKGIGTVFCGSLINPNDPKILISNLDNLYFGIKRIDQSNWKEFNICSNCLSRAGINFEKQSIKLPLKKKKKVIEMKKLKKNIQSNQSKPINKKRKNKSFNSFDPAYSFDSFYRSIDRWNSKHPNKRINLTNQSNIYYPPIQLKQITPSGCLNEINKSMNHLNSIIQIPEFAESIESITPIIDAIPILQSNPDQTIRIEFPELNLELIKGFGDNWMFIEKIVDSFGIIQSKPFSEFMSFEEAINFSKMLNVA